ncbi:NADH:ubiquinone oxidoreductase [Saxophila tyrrhenica]|uniref:NADH:ubiquinone oxidoreductase n=1 Tax=Saxophila tyrrhenica TaxID=1690608 RepID=A0AAV9PAM7_9PEZI|nr:NADH:ubiquinone oxidoreductase [Saxophila tyrrhenica]
MSSPMRPGASLEEELDYYKKQYEQLEADLADFQASSKELEEQLERDIETAEKNERKLKEQIEKLKYEAEEWKTKHQQSKVESNNAQNVLQKEITAMRDTNRTLQLRLRDIEVVNDDYERQARNTESSLEDMESKYSVAIERSVLLEGEVKTGEQEREALRIETQRLRDELGDLKIESDITLEKLSQADQTIERLRSRKPSPLAVESLRARSPGSEASGITPSSPTVSTSPPKSDSVSDAPTPPSPPLSDAPLNDPASTLRPGAAGSRTAAKHSRGPSVASSTATSEAKAMRPPPRPRQFSRPSLGAAESLPRSDSLYQIRTLRGRMQKIEERVHSARSKLPSQPKERTPKNSPSTRLEPKDNLPATVTMRRSIKRPSSNLGCFADAASDVASTTNSDAPSRRDSHIKRLSFGIPRPTSSAADRPGSALDRPPSAAAVSRPSSRASLASASANLHPERPGSRAGARTPIGQLNFAFNPTAAQGRPRSSVGGTYATVHGTPRSHRPSASISELRYHARDNDTAGGASSPGRSSAMSQASSITPYPAGRRQSAGISTPKTVAKRASTTGIGGKEDAGVGAMRPPPSRRKMSDVGETY